MLDFNWILLALSLVVLLSYGFDLLSQHSRIPSVVMLILSGIGLRFGMDLLGWKIAFLDLILPTLGTLGLILIVLDGALELRLTREAKSLITRAAVVAVLGVLLCGLMIAAGFHYFGNVDWYHAWVAATPFAIISSAVAIPAANRLAPKTREFVVYESALSDIFGVLLFYALVDAERGVTSAVVNVFTGIGLSTLIGAIFGLIILFLIERIVAHVRFVPMIFGLVLVYAGSKLLHLAPLVSVLAVGLILNNIALLTHFPVLRSLASTRLETDVEHFKHLTAEMTFVVRTFFFVLLGYSTSLLELSFPLAWVVAAFILSTSLLGRFVLLKSISRDELRPLLWFAPRGLITVLLYMSTPPHLRIAAFPEGALMLAVLGSIVLMTVGTLMTRHHKNTGPVATR